MWVCSQGMTSANCKDLHFMLHGMLAVQLETAAREAKSLQHALAAREQVNTCPCGALMSW